MKSRCSGALGWSRDIVGPCHNTRHGEVSTIWAARDYHCPSCLAGQASIESLDAAHGSLNSLVKSEQLGSLMVDSPLEELTQTEFS